MADDTYQPLVYMKQEGNELVVASSGLVTVESGGKIDVEDGGQIAYSVVVDTSAASLANSGVSILVNGSSAPTTFTIDAPVAGVEKYIACDGSFGTTAIGYIDVGSGITVSSTQRYMSITSAYARMHLIGINTTSWALLAATGSTVSTGAT